MGRGLLFLSSEGVRCLDAVFDVGFDVDRVSGLFAEQVWFNNEDSYSRFSFRWNTTTRYV
jgi:hypothetical protein